MKFLIALVLTLCGGLAGSAQAQSVSAYLPRASVFAQNQYNGTMWVQVAPSDQDCATRIEFQIWENGVLKTTYTAAQYGLYMNAGTGSWTVKLSDFDRACVKIGTRTVAIIMN